MGAYPDRPLGRKVQPGESLLLVPSPLYPSDRLALPMISGLCRALGLQESYSLRWASFCLNCGASFIPHLLPTGVLVWAILSMLICHCVRRGALIRSTPLCLAPSPEPRVLAQQSTGKDHRGGLWEQAGPQECLCLSVSPACLPAGDGPSPCQPLSVALQRLVTMMEQGVLLTQGIAFTLLPVTRTTRGHRHILG